MSISARGQVLLTAVDLGRIGRHGAYRLRPHPYTNLEEIADWLTQIILGASLIELTNMPDRTCSR
jgi:hypothetical protein